MFHIHSILPLYKSGLQKFTKTFLYSPRTYKIKQTTMVGACTKKETQKARGKLYTNRDDTGIQGLSPK